MKHYYLLYWLERLEQSDKLLEITQLVDGRGWPLQPRLASSKIHTLLSHHAASPGGEAVVMAATLGAPTKCQGQYADRHLIFTYNYIHLARLVFLHFTAVQRSLRNFPKVRKQLGSKAGNGSRWAWIENWGLLSSYHLLWDGNTRGRGAGGWQGSHIYTHAHTHTHTHTHTGIHSWPITRSAASTTQGFSATPFGRQGNQTRTQTWPLAVYRWMLLSSLLKPWCEHFP